VVVSNLAAWRALPEKMETTEDNQFECGTHFENNKKCPEQVARA